MDTSIQKIKQPSPSVSDNSQKNNQTETKKYKTIPAANIGVINVPKITSTPLRDWVEIKRQENPYTIYKIKGKDYSLKGFQTVAGLGVVACGIASIIKLFKK